MRRFENRRVIVTGAASGIGRAVAERLAREGGDVRLADRNIAGLAEVAGGIAAAGGRATTQPYDAAIPGDGVRMVSAALEAVPRLDAVLNIAGIYRRAHFAETSTADWDLVLRINLTSVFEICQAALPALIGTRGAIVNTASTAGLRGIAYAAPYAAAKAGVIALSQSLAAEVAHRGVRVNVVAPGRVRTAIAAGLAPVAGARAELAVHPAKLLDLEAGAEPADIAGTYAWLASPDAAFVSGEVTVVDGAHGVG